VIKWKIWDVLIDSVSLAEVGWYYRKTESDIFSIVWSWTLHPKHSWFSSVAVSLEPYTCGYQGSAVLDHESPCLSFFLSSSSIYLICDNSYVLQSYHIVGHQIFEECVQLKVSVKPPVSRILGLFFFSPS
jgi:hypothetical protein